MKRHALSIALFCATIMSDTYSMDIKKEKPVDVNSPVLPHILDIHDSNGITPLHSIIVNENCTDEQRIKWIEKLVRHGADINKGATNINARDFTALHLAVYNKRSPVVIDALLKYGANMRLVDYLGRTPIALAVHCVHEDQLETLLNHISGQDNAPVLPSSSNVSHQQQ